MTVNEQPSEHAIERASLEDSYKYVAPGPLPEIDVEIKALEAEVHGLLREVTE
jgi:hypothetical protein